MNNWLVYEHISPSGKVYVGITSRSAKARWQRGTGYTKCKVFNRAIKKYGWDNIEHTIIATNLGEMTAKNMEKDFIAFYKRSNKSYNMSDGGDGSPGVPCNEKQREFAGSIWRGKKIPEEIRIKMSEARKGVKLSKQHIENIRKSKVGNKNGNKALVVKLNGEIIAEYESCVVAAKELGTHPNCISRCCRGENKTWHGYTLEYKSK